ncbi:hypothetical protein ACQ8DQ_004792, partial [Escherichia coli]
QGQSHAWYKAITKPCNWMSFPTVISKPSLSAKIPAGVVLSAPKNVEQISLSLTKIFSVYKKPATMDGILCLIFATS